MLVRRWAVNIVGMVLAAVLGEWLCLQRELQEIPIGMQSWKPC